MLTLKNCRLIPELTEGFEGTAADIVLDKGLIEGIYPVGMAPAGEGCETLDMKGMTVLPGFFDLHAHLPLVNQDWNQLKQTPQNEYVLNSARYAKKYLELGFTTIRDCGHDYYAGVAVRDYINNGTLTGCRVITSGKILTPTTRGNSSFGAMYKEVDSPADMLRVCRQETEQGVDFIKYMCTGAVLNLGGVPGAMVTTPAELRAVAEAAETLGTYVAAHCHGTQGIKEAVKAGIKTIEHASYMDEESAELMLKHGTYGTVPTLAMPYTLARDYSGATLPEFIAKSSDAIRHMVESMKLAAQAGVTVGFGTDLDFENAAKYPGIEFEARAEYGIDNITVLRQATIDSARIVRMDDRLGTVKAGKIADLVVIDGKPDEDISAMKQYPAHVFKAGAEFRG